MSKPGGYVHVPFISHDYEHREEYQKEQERRDRTSVLRTVLTFAHDRELTAVETIELTEMLGLDEQLDELVAGDGKRQRRLEDLRRQLGLSEDELEDRAVDGNIG